MFETNNSSANVLIIIIRTYEFKIREVLERTVKVNAESRGEAENFVNNLYHNEKIVLDAEDLVEDDRDCIN